MNSVSYQMCQLAKCALLVLALAAPQPVAAQKKSGEELFDLVKTYSDMGVHRVGTEVGQQQIRWFSEQLEAVGGQVSLHTNASRPPYSNLCTLSSR